MKLRFLILVPFFAVLTSGAMGQSAPLDHAEVLGRLAVGYSPSYIAHLVKVRGVGFSSSDDFDFRVKLAGGEGILVERFIQTDLPGQAHPLSYSEPSFYHLAKCAAGIIFGLKP
jgi:hypothetical protein